MPGHPQSRTRSCACLAVLWGRLAIVWRRLAIPWRRLAIPWRHLAIPWRRLAMVWRHLAVPWRRPSIPWRRLAIVWALVACSLGSFGAAAATAAGGWDGFGSGDWPGPSWRPYASTSPFNLTTEGATVHPNSAAIVKAALSWGPPASLVDSAGTSDDWAHPTYWAQATDPVYTLHATEPWGANPLEGMRIPIPEAARPADGGDAHMTVVTPDGWEYDFWHATAPPKGGGTFSFGWGGRTRIDGNGLGSGGTAAKFGNLAGVIREPELAAGKIDHALFIVLKCAAKGTGFGYGATASSNSSYVYPANQGGSTCGLDNPDLPPLGTRFMLAMSDAQIQALPVPSWKKTILTALAHYGGYVGDTGGSGFGFMFESSATYTSLGYPDPLAAFAKANGLPSWEGRYVFNLAGGVEWERYLRVLVPPTVKAAPSDQGYDGFGGQRLPGAGWRPYASSSPFNLSTEGATVHPNSAAIVQKVLSWAPPGNLVAGTAETASDWSHPTYYARPSDPVYTLHAIEPWGANPLNGMQIRIPTYAKPAGGSGDMTIVTPDGWEYDFWHASAPTGAGGSFSFGWGGRTRIDGNGLGSRGTEAGFGDIAGMIREPELAAGKIDHALFIVLKCAAKGTGFGYGATAGSNSSYVYPANHGGSACPNDEADLPPLGTRFMLAMSDAQIQALPVPGWKKTILTALAHYGGYVGDTGGSGFGLMFESGSTYTALGLPDPMVRLAQEDHVPTWEGRYVFNLAGGVEWEKHLRVLVPPGA